MSDNSTSPIEKNSTHLSPDFLEKVGQWLSVPDFAARLGTEAASVRGAIRDHRIVGYRESTQHGAQIPEIFLVSAHLANAADPLPAPPAGQEKEIILPSLKGTIVVLADSGLQEHAILEWLFTEHEDLGTTPIAALRSGNKSAVRRAALVV